MTPERFKLTPADKLSPLWRALEAHYTDVLATLRAKNDAMTAPEQTALLRGRIAEVKNLLALAEEGPQAPK